MDNRVFQIIRASLLQQRQTLTGWLSATPVWKKQIRLGPADEHGVRDHLLVLATAIEKTQDQTLGLCEVCHGYVEPSRLEMDYTCCVCLDDLSAADRSRLESELESSSRVQRALLPQHMPEIPGLELAAFTRPADIVGGDYFDFFNFRDGAHGLVIGDVAGHGMSAALFMASLQASLHTLVPDHEAPAEVLRRLNVLFCHNIRMTSFVTLFLARFDSRTSSLTYCNAGHNPPMLVRTESSGKVSQAWLQPTAPAIGLVEGFQSSTETVTLEPGDVLLLYTDGVTEAVNPRGEEFGPDRLAELVRGGSLWSAQDLVREVRRCLQDFTHPQPLADDATIVALKSQRQ